MNWKIFFGRENKDETKQRVKIHTKTIYDNSHTHTHLANGEITTAAKWVDRE